MITRQELIEIAKQRMQDAQVLLGSGRYEGARYLCGYAIEVMLKARLCKQLKWDEFPSSNGEFKNGFAQLKTHNFEILLLYSGMQRKVKKSYLVDWSIVGQWSPDVRYAPPGNFASGDANAMYESTRKLVALFEP